MYFHVGFRKMNRKNNRLRLIVGGKAASPKSRKTMTAAGLLDENDLEVWQLVQQLPPPEVTFNSIRQNMAREKEKVEKLLAEGIQKLKEIFSNIDLNAPANVTPEMREMLHSWPLVPVPGGMVGIND